jgi:pimeloyl-ACP methyl ester carboxylesterase
MKTGGVWPGCLALAAGAAALRADDFLSNGVKIHYEIAGQGEPVILIHGLASSARINWDMPGVTARLAKNFQVITLDNRGHGQSDKPEGEDQYGLEMVEDVVRLMDHLHIQKARLVGYSLGGMIAMKLLTLHPDRVKSVVLGGMGWLKAGGGVQRFWEALPSHRRASVPPACVQGMAKLGVTEEQVKAMRVPVTILAGDHDPCQRLYIEPLLQIRPDWPEHIIKNAGHLNCVVKKEFKDELEEALRQPTDGPPPAKQ